MEDIMEGCINESVVIDFEVPKVIQELIDETEQFAANGDLGSYENYSEELHIACKNAYAGGYMTKEQWQTIERKYT